MSRPTLFRWIFCIFLLSLFLYRYTDQQNILTDLRMQLPLIVKEIRLIEEENKRLHYQIEQFENPEKLMELARRSEFGHLRHPLVKEVLMCQEGIALQYNAPPGEEQLMPKSTLSLAVGMKP
jgi:hypothetical protein